MEKKKKQHAEEEKISLRFKQGQGIQREKVKTYYGSDWSKNIFICDPFTFSRYYKPFFSRFFFFLSLPKGNIM